MMTRLLALSLALSFTMSPAMAWAERVWDSELKRYLTEQEMSMAEVFLSEEEAVKLMFPKSERIKKDILRVPTDKKMAIEERIGWKFPEDAFEVYIGETGDAGRRVCLGAKYHRQTQADDLYGRSGCTRTCLERRTARLSRSARQRGANQALQRPSMKGKRSSIRSASTKTSSTSAAPPCRFAR